jgi:uroporphyrinogen-III synthase
MFLIVRTKDQLKKTVRFFEEKGVECESLAISSTQLNKIDLEDNIDGIIVTSSNAVLSIPQTKLPFFCVGESSEKECIETGRRVAFCGKQGAEEMASEMAKKFPPMNLIHAAGDTADISWYDVLKNKDIQVENKIAYETIYVESLPSTISEKIKQKDLETILLFSVQGADIFNKSLENEKIDLSTLSAITFSQNIADRCKGYKKVYIASSPTLDAVKNIIESL